MDSVALNLRLLYVVGSRISVHYLFLTKLPLCTLMYFSGFLTASKYCGSGLKKDIQKVTIKHI